MVRFLVVRVPIVSDGRSMETWRNQGHHSVEGGQSGST
jgi:hypothetical protein